MSAKTDNRLFRKKTLKNPIDKLFRAITIVHEMGHKYHIGEKRMRQKNQDTFVAIERYINEFVCENGYCPTVREIAAGIGASKTTTHRYMEQMREEGTIDYSGYRHITTSNTRTDSVRVPVLGSVSCGMPKFAEENIEEYIRLPVSLFGKGEFFILRAYGDSMIDVGIDDGDLVLVRKQDQANDGQIVVALVDDSATLKRFYRDPKNKRFRLHPENAAYEDIFVDHCDIQGVAVTVLKFLE